MAQTQYDRPACVPVAEFSLVGQVAHVSPMAVEAYEVYVLGAQGSQASDVAVPAAMRTEPAGHEVDHAVQFVDDAAE